VIVQIRLVYCFSIARISRDLILSTEDNDISFLEKLNSHLIYTFDCQENWPVLIK